MQPLGLSEVEIVAQLRRLSNGQTCNDSYSVDVVITAMRYGVGILFKLVAPFLF